jgi:phosphoribosylglycinamide formyltransferase 1
MASIAVFASGNGSNFQAIIEALEAKGHRVAVLVSDRKDAFVNVRAENAGIPVEKIRYSRDVPREEIERELLERLSPYSPELIVMAGFMRILSPVLIDAYRGRIINIHPSLLPKYPGTRGIEESYASNDAEAGVTVHLVDYGLDSGPILRQERIERIEGESLESFEERIHTLEHRVYPEVVLRILEGDTPSA